MLATRFGLQQVLGRPRLPQPFLPQPVARSTPRRVSREEVQTALLPTSERAAGDGAGAGLLSIVFTGSGFSAVFSSSCTPFLKDLMPCATSPIRSEILPRPNNSRTTAITTIQCQMLSEPILQPSKHAAGNPA